MIEIKETNSVKEMARDSAKSIKIASIVMAWAKIEKEERYTDEQKNFLARATMHEIWRIFDSEGGNECETQAF